MLTLVANKHNKLATELNEHSLKRKETVIKLTQKLQNEKTDIHTTHSIGILWT